MEQSSKTFVSDELLANWTIADKPPYSKIRSRLLEEEVDMLCMQYENDFHINIVKVSGVWCMQETNSISITIYPQITKTHNCLDKLKEVNKLR